MTFIDFTPDIDTTFLVIFIFKRRYLHSFIHSILDSSNCNEFVVSLSDFLFAIFLLRINAMSSPIDHDYFMVSGSPDDAWKLICSIQRVQTAY